MALSVSRRILRSFGSFHCQSSPASHDFYGHVSGNWLFRVDSKTVVKDVPFSIYCQRLSTTILAPGTGDGSSFPGDSSRGLMILAGDVFDVPIRKDIIHHVVLWQLAKRQQGTYSTKAISEVNGTGKKPYQQKGTGRARHGTLRGPQLLVFEDLEVPSHKTNHIVNYVNEMENTNKVLLVDGGPINEKLKLATQNLHYVNVLPSIGLTIYNILLLDTLVMSRSAVDRIVERLHTRINR